MTERQRPLLVATRGRLLPGVVPAAGVQDRDGTLSVLDVRRHRFAHLRLIGADQAGVVRLTRRSFHAGVACRARAQPSPLEWWSQAVSVG